MKCFSEEKCSPLPASDYEFEQKMAFVAPWLYQKNKRLLRVPSGSASSYIQILLSIITIFKGNTRREERVFTDAK